MCLILIWRIRDFVLKPMVEIAPYLAASGVEFNNGAVVKKAA